MGRRLDRCRGEELGLKCPLGEGGVVPGDDDAEHPSVASVAVRELMGVISLKLKWSPAPMCAVCLKSVGTPIIVRSIFGLLGF